MLQRVCLKPNWSLRRQLFVSFGATATISIGIVMLIGALTATLSGQSVKIEARNSITKQTKNNILGATSRYVADTITKKFSNFGGAASLLEETTRDRFVGYPDMPGYATDELVPFFDSETGKNMYPLDSPLVPLEWNITSNVDVENQHEHLQDRWEWYLPEAKVSTAYASYFMQGQCDPSAASDDPTYYEGCTELHNDIVVGGARKPTVTNELIAKKAADLSFILKPLYESHEDIKTIGIYFVNAGAGSHISYPSTIADGRLTYESIGCEWLQSKNPLGMALATSDEISLCDKGSGKGRIVKLRDYNALERDWCRNQALAPGTTASVGPYLDATSKNLWLMTFGRAVFDRDTKRFIACTLVDVSIKRINEILRGVKVGETSNIALVRWEDGTVVSSSTWNTDEATETLNIEDANLNMGVDEQVFAKMKGLVDFTRYWDPSTVKEAYANEIFTHNGKLVMMNPVPVPPDDYDEVYSPEFMVIMSIEEMEVFYAIDAMDSKVDDVVHNLIKNNLIVGFLGIACVLIIIWLVARSLTKPLNWMQKVAGQIIDNAGGNLGSGISAIDDNDQTAWCTPRTELTVLLEEFKKMVLGFSGEGASKVAKHQNNEVKNNFTWRNEYDTLYSTATSRIPSYSPVPSAPPLSDLPPPHVPHLADVDPENPLAEPPSNKRLGLGTFSSSGPDVITLLEHSSGTRGCVNLGTNLKVHTADTLLRKDGPPQVINHKRLILSPIFWWISVLIAVPLLATMITICVIVTNDITTALPTWLEDVEVASVALESDAIATTAIARAAFSAEVMKQPVRDLYIYARVAGWLLFGGLIRSSSFTEMTTGAYECKDKEVNTCDYLLLDDPRTPCSCEWEDSHGIDCRNYVQDPRYEQRRFHAGLNQDISDETIGTREKLAFVKRSPGDTSWWLPGLEGMPGIEKGSNVSGYSTTYDRVRVLSAMSVIELPLYNYKSGTDKHLGTYIGLNTDGMMVGWAGCDYTHANYPHFQSTEENRAADIASHLCPLDNYGYDCRCRDWYATGKEKGQTHITPPYIFASSNLPASSATFPLVDPVTKGHVGQALLDFLPGDIMKSLESGNTIIGQGKGGFPIVITPETDVTGGDTVVGPGYQITDSASITDVVLPHNDVGSPHRYAFESEVVQQMKDGGNGTAHFMRKSKDGKDEIVFIAYAKISVTTLLPIDPSDFSRGSLASDSLIYSLGIAVLESDLSLPFAKIEDNVSRKIDVAMIVLIALICVSAVLVGFVTYVMAASIARPMVVLTDVVQRINDKTLKGDMPEVNRGSLEVSDVHASFTKLYTVVRFSCAAFFAGDLEKARVILIEALHLFQSIGNNKAQGIANNNLGNTYLALYEETEDCDLYRTGKEHFDDAVVIATHERALCRADDKVDYTRQLSNRHFNRGIFVCTMCKKMTSGEVRLDSGLQDILAAKNLDDELDLLVNGSDLLLEVARFERIVGRAHGMISLASKCIEDVWGIAGLLDQLESMLFRNWEHEEHPLFEEINRVGRQQQIYDLHIRHETTKGKTLAAAEFAVKMLTDDEYIIASAYVNAVIALAKFFQDLNSEEQQKIGKRKKKQILRERLKQRRESQGMTEEDGADVTADANGVISKEHSSIVGATMGGKRKELKHANELCVLKELKVLLKDNKNFTSVSNKNIIFCLDYSYSMKGGRIRRASKNLLLIYDNHCYPDDFVGFIRFNHEIDYRLTFNLERKKGNSERHRTILRGAVDAKGGTRLYNAVDCCVTMANIAGDEASTNDTWIVALTDGESSDNSDSVVQRIRAINQERLSQIHLILVGCEVSNIVVEACKRACTVTDKSIYIDARGGLDQMDEAFEHVASIISGSAVTMETF